MTSAVASSCRDLAALVADGWARAAGVARDVIRKYYRWDAGTVCVEFAGPGLVPALTRALGHREVEASAQPALIISAWDRASTGVDALPPGLVSPSLRVDRGPAGELEVGLVRSGDTISVLDRPAARGFFWTPDARDIPAWICAGPWRVLLHWWWRPQGRQIVHAAAVGRGGSGVLLVGHGGSGKSTTAFACLRAGMDLLGEDYCLVVPNLEVRAVALYGTGKLTDDTLEVYPALSEMVAPLTDTRRCDSNKQLFFLDPAFRPRLAAEMRVKAILLPEIAGGEACEVIPASAGDGLRAMAPSTLLQTPGAGDADLRQMSRIVGALPIYRLRLCRDLDRVVTTIESILVT